MKLLSKYIFSALFLAASGGSATAFNPCGRIRIVIRLMWIIRI